MASLYTLAGSLVTNALEQKYGFNVVEFSSHKNFPIVTFLEYKGGDIVEHNYLVVLKHRQTFVDSESPQVTVTKAAVERAEKVSEDYPIGSDIKIAFGFVVDGEDKQGKFTDVVFVPKETHDAYKVKGGVFSVGDRGGNFHYRRDRFEEAQNMNGVDAIRMRYTF